MKYFIRSLKTFVYFSVLFVIITLCLYYFVRSGQVSSYADMFKEGALVKIVLFFILVGAVYPSFGFGKKKIDMPGGYAPNADKVREIMKGFGYEYYKEDEEKVVFRHRSFITRLFKMGEGQLTFFKNTEPVIMEGLRKDTYRYGSSLEFRLNPKEEEK